MKIGGVTVRPGDLVLLDIGAANHDPGRFAEPGQFDAVRPATYHLSFGHGGRYCLGAPLARLELRAVFSQLIPRFPALRLTLPPEPLKLNRDTLTSGLAQLPVTW
jgi:cytochrome P450